MTAKAGGKKNPTGKQQNEAFINSEKPDVKVSSSSFAQLFFFFFPLFLFPCFITAFTHSYLHLLNVWSAQLLTRRRNGCTDDTVPLSYSATVVRNSLRKKYQLS